VRLKKKSIEKNVTFNITSTYVMIRARKRKGSVAAHFNKSILIGPWHNFERSIWSVT
jgi:hypothetical protein